MTLALAVRITELVAEPGEIADDGLAVAENALKDFLAMQAWSKVQMLCRGRV
jgi:hypothetical protein